MKKMVKMEILFLLLLLILFSGLRVTAANNYENLNIALPEAYPEKLLPLIEGHAVRFSGFADKGDYQELTVNYYAEADPAEVAAHYEKLMSQGSMENISQLGEGHYNLVGELDGIKILVMIVQEDQYANYQSHITTIIEGDFKDKIQLGERNNKADLSSANKNIKDFELIPEEYPLNLLPIYGGSLLTYGEMMDDGEKEIILLQFFSKDSSEEVRDFYAKVLQDSQSKEYYTFEMGDITYNLIGVLDKYKASFTISNPMYDYNGYTTLINLSVEDLN